MTRRAVTMLALGGILGLAVLPARAQVHRLDPFPWSALADSTSRSGVVVSWDLDLGGDAGWRGQRLGLALRIPVGRSGLVYLGGHYTRLESEGGGALVRWPDLRAEDLTAEDAAAWPGEALQEDFGQPEVGLLMPMGLPLLGAGAGAFAVRLPFGKEELYPLESRAMALRVGWRRQGLDLGPWQLSGRVGWEVALDASGEVFAPEAFPDGFRYGVEVGSPAVRTRGASLGWQARELSEGRHLRQAVAEAWAEVAGRHRVRVTVVRELGVTRHRLADWRVGVSLELRRPLPAAEEQGNLPAAAGRGR